MSSIFFNCTINRNKRVLMIFMDERKEKNELAEREMRRCSDEKEKYMQTSIYIYRGVPRGGAWGVTPPCFGKFCFFLLKKLKKKVFWC
jgi:hypothetical protein